MSKTFDGPPNAKFFLPNFAYLKIHKHSHYKHFFMHNIFVYNIMSNNINKEPILNEENNRYTLFPIKYTIFNSYSTTVAYLTMRGKQFFT